MRRNNYKYGEAVSVSRVIYQVCSTLQALVRVGKPSLQNLPHKWLDLLHMLELYTSKLKVSKVLWDLPTPGWIKFNKGGASKGNSGRSSIGFVVRDEERDVRFALGKEIQEGTNTEAKAVAILEALRYCVKHGYTHFLMKTDSHVNEECS